MRKKRIDSDEARLRAWIIAGMAAMHITAKDLARLTGIAEATLSSRIGHGGDVGTLRFREFQAIKKVFQRGGVLEMIGGIEL